MQSYEKHYSDPRPVPSRPVPSRPVPSRPVPSRPQNDIPLIHSIKQVYASIYQIGNKLPKREKLGIHAEIEQVTLEIISDILHASLAPKVRKTEYLEKTRISLELVKHLVRIEHELKIIDERAYIRIESMLVEASKMTNGWIKYLTQNPTK